MKLKILRNKKAITPVISEIILLAAVIAIGFSALAWAQYQGAVYQQTQAPIVSNDINKLQEILNLEGSTYNSGTLNIYLLNSGSANITIQSVILDGVDRSSLFTMETLSNPPQQIDNHSLNATSGMREGIIVLSDLGLTPGQSYPLQITTTRGTQFAYTIAF